MKSNASFAEILSEKIAPKDSSQTQNCADTSTNDPLGLAFMLGHFEKYKFNKNKKDCFAQPTKSFQFHKYTQTPRKEHQLTPEQEKSFLFFQSRDAMIQRHFSKIELKKSFRQLALRLHPDHGGSAQTFIELKNHYAVLIAIFQQNKGT